MSRYHRLKIFIQHSLIVITLGSFNSAYSAYEADMADSVSNSELPEFTFRFDGANVGDQLGYYAINAGDFDGNGKMDLVIGARQNQGSIKKGEAYLIFDETLNEIRAQNNGNEIDLSDYGPNSNWNIKFIGEAEGDAGARVSSIVDFNQNGKDDLTFNSYKANSAAIDEAGSTYLILSDLFDGDISNMEVSYSLDSSAGCGINRHERGCKVELSDSNNWNIKINGTQSGEHAGAFYSWSDYYNDENNINHRYPDLVLGTLSERVYLIPGYAIHDQISSNGALLTGITLNADFANSSGGYSIDTNAVGLNGATGYVSDVTGDGIPEMIITAQLFNDPCEGLLNGAVYIIKKNILSNSVNGILDLSNSSNYSLRIIGGIDSERLDDQDMLGDLFGYSSVGVADFNNNGIPDFFASAPKDLGASPRNLYDRLPKSVYIILDNKINEWLNSGNKSVCINDVGWSLRVDAPEKSSPPVDASLWQGVNAFAQDVNNDGKTDLIFDNYSADLAKTGETRDSAGNWYVVFNEMLNTIENPSNDILDLSLQENLAVRYIGANAIDGFGYSIPEFKDINNDGTVDAIVPAWEASPNSKNDAGSVYIIEYFPHSIIPDDMSGVDFFDPNGFQFTGLVDAPNNVSTISRVQFGHHRSFGKHVEEVCPNLDPDCIVNSDEFHMLWLECEAADGAFDSNYEPYICDHSPLSTTPGALFEAPHQLYMRAQDEKGIWTPISRYQLVQFPPQAPVLLTQIQSLNNHSTQGYNEPSSPWLEVAVHNLNLTSAQIALERSEVAAGEIAVAETVGILTVESGRRGGFEDNTDTTIRYETLLTDRLFKGFNTCIEQTFQTTFSTSPLVIAAKSSRYGGDGGWLRRCSLSNSAIGLTVDEDRYRDTERSHTTEKVSIMAFSLAFHQRFAQDDENWQMEVQETVVSGHDYLPIQFSKAFDEPPLVFVLADRNGGDPATVRIRSVNETGFEARVVEPLNEDGSHNNQTLHYLAITPGDHRLPDGTKIKAQTIDISNFQAGQGVTGTESWQLVNF